MYIKKSHRTPFLGFDWDHPLREAYRTPYKSDPAVCEHPTWYTVVAMWPALILGPLLIAAVVMIFGGVPESANRSFYWVSTGIELVLIGIVLIIHFTTIRWSWDLNKKAGERFIAAMTELAGLFDTTVEALARCNQNNLREAATRLLVDDAKRLLVCESLFPSPMESCRIKAKDLFDAHYELMRSNELIGGDPGYGSYFVKAKQILKELE